MWLQPPGEMSHQGSERLAASACAVKWSPGDCCCSDAPSLITMKQTISIFVVVFLLTGYLLREIQKANIAVPEEDESPLAPPPRQVLEIMVSATFDAFYMHTSILVLIVFGQTVHTVSSSFSASLNQQIF